MSANNSLILIGNLTKDPEFKVFEKTESTLAEFSIAVNKKSSRGEDKPMFIDCKAWSYKDSKLAENIVEYCTKGKKVAVKGELAFDQWENEKGKFSKHFMQVYNVEFLWKKED